MEKFGEGEKVAVKSSPYIYIYIYTFLGDKQKQKISFEKFSTNLLVQI